MILKESASLELVYEGKLSSYFAEENEHNINELANPALLSRF